MAAALPQPPASGKLKRNDARCATGCNGKRHRMGQIAPLSCIVPLNCKEAPSR